MPLAPRIPSAYRRYRSRLSQQGELVRWIVLVFLGGSVNTLVTQLYAKWLTSGYQYLVNTNFSSLTGLQFGLGVSEFFLISGAFFITPIVLSFSLTRILPSRQMVPPFYVQIVTFGLYINIAYLTSGLSLTTFFTLYLLAFWVFMGGLVQDGIVTRLMGRGVLREDIIGFTLALNESSDRVIKLLSRREFANRLDIKTSYYETKKGFAFPPEESSSGDTAIEVWKGSAYGEDTTTLVMCAWYEGRYDIRRDANVEEYAREGLAYLKDLLSNPRPDEKERKPIECKEGRADDIDELRDRIIDEAGGVVVHTERISTVGWLQIIGFLVMVSVSFGLIIVGGTEATLAGIGAIVSMGVYLIFALPSRFGRRGVRHI